MVAITSSSRALRPRKRSLANAKPASEQNTTTEMVAVDATRTLLSRARRKATSALSKTRCTFVPSSSPGVNGGVGDAMSLLGREAITTMKYSGPVDSARMTSSSRYVSGLVRRNRLARARSGRGAPARGATWVRTLISRLPGCGAAAPG
jgi:hypothetical protein